MRKITSRQVINVKRYKRYYPDKSNAEIGKMVNPSLSNTSVSKILKGEYDHILGLRRTGKVKHLKFYEIEEIVKADRILRDNPTLTIKEVSEMEQCSVGCDALCSISIGRYDDIIDKYAGTVGQMTIEHSQRFEDDMEKTYENERVSDRSMCLSLSVRQDEAIEELAWQMRMSKSAVVRSAIDRFITEHDNTEEPERIYKAKDYKTVWYKPLKADVQPCFDDNYVQCIECGSENVKIIDVLKSKGKTAKLKCEKCGQVMYLSTANWSKDGKRYERKMW